MRSSRPREFEFYATLLARVLRCLPRQSYRAYGDELAGVYRDELSEIHDSAGMKGVRSRMPALIADAGTALCLELVDVWRHTWLAPQRLAVVLMLGLPALALVASRVGVGPGTEPQRHSVLGASIAATAITWTIVTCHIVA